MKDEISSRNRSERDYVRFSLVINGNLFVVYP
jgi:hypothetical protein